MAKEIKYINDMVRDYRTEDIIAYLDKGMAVAVQTMDKAIANQNLAQFGSTSSVITEAWAIIHKMNEKMNGTKPKEVL